jgi:hypothetical protein
MSRLFTRRVDLFDGSSAQSSTYTSSAILAADYERITLSWQTDIAAASVLTVQGSNEDGLTASITTWSTISTMNAPGIYTIDPGVRWLRAQRRSNESLSIARLQLRS